MSSIFAVLGRVLIAAYFVISGLVKLLAPVPFEAIYAIAGIAPRWVAPVGIIEIVGGILLALGLLTRATAIVLAAYAAANVLYFHNQFDDPTQADTILLHGALIGGLLLVFAHSQIWWSLDAMRRNRRTDAIARRAELRAHDAQLRAARADQHVTVVGTPIDPAAVPVAKRSWF